MSVVSLAGAWVAPARVNAAQPSPPKLLGPVLIKAENATVSWGPDGGVSVPLPNGQDFWIFADTPRYQYQQGAWKLTGFIPGSTAGEASFTPGKPLQGPLNSIIPGRKPNPRNKPALFVPNGTTYFRDGSGRLCNKANGGSKANSVRWPIGAALMPDKTNILIPYVMVCVINERIYTAEGWGFTEFNWKTNKFSIKPVDVFPPNPDGSKVGSLHFFGSPVVVGNKVTYYSWMCCAHTGDGVYTTTLGTSLAVLKNPASYVPTPVSNLPATWEVSVEPKSKTHASFTMYMLRGSKGEYNLYSAPAPTGPWTQTASGVLPRCDKSSSPCHSINIHSELSPASRLLVSYHLPGFGPGVATKHPYPRDPLRHLVMASIPCNC